MIRLKIFFGITLLFICVCYSVFCSATSSTAEIILVGTTPVDEAIKSCFKLKWRLILTRDSATYLPKTYTIRKIIDGQPRDVSGKWSIMKGTAKNPDLIVYKIESDKSDESMSFLVGDDIVLFFLNKNNELYLGNENFSFTLNKKPATIPGDRVSGLLRFPKVGGS